MKLRVLLLLLFVSLISFAKPAEAAFEWGDGGGVGTIDQTWQEVMAGDQVVLPVFIRQVGLWTLKWGDNTLWGEQADGVGGSGAGSLPTAQRKGGVIQGAANLAGLIYENPAGISTVNYLASINPIPQARAATGAEQLGLALPLWKITRNLAYLLTSIVLVAFGLMIMFRKKIDPRTTVTISQALPKIIITLILITFSYPIAGILFDVMNVGKSLTHTVLKNQLREVFTGHEEEIGNLYIGEKAFPDNFSAFDIWTVFGIGGGIKDLFSGKGGSAVVVSYKGIIELDAAILIRLVMGILLFSISIKLLLSLLSYYIRFFLLTISAPLTFLWGSLPGQEEHATRWFMQFITTSVVFVTVYLMMNLAYFFYLYASISGVDIRVPYVLGNYDTTMLGKLMAFGIILTLPSIPETIEDMLAPTKKRGKPISETVSRGMKNIPIIGGMLG